MKIISRQQALRLGLKNYFTGKPCKRGHVAAHYVSGGCVECVRAACCAWDVSHSKKRQAYRLAHPEKARVTSRAWRTANPASVGLMNALRRAPHCVPANFDLEATIPFYAKARRLTRETGIKHEVDHKKALILGGMHVASNLQVITAEANRQKAKAERAEARRRK